MITTDGTADLDGRKVTYTTRGRGERALLHVHGASADRTHWTHQMEGLETERLLVAVDLPGHGASDPAEGAYSMGLHARALAAVLDHLGLARAVLVGHSNGVPVAREFYRLFPARTEALVAVDGPFLPVLSEGVVAWMRAALARPDYREFMRGMSAMTPRGGLSERDFERVKATAEVPREVLAGWLDAMQADDIWREDPIEVPLLVLRAGGGQHDTPDVDAALARIAPRAEVRDFEGAGHFLMMERAREVDAALAAFLARLDPR